MIGVGFGVTLAGYTMMWWGWERMHGPGVGFANLLVPGRWAGHAKPAGSSSSSSSGGGSSAPLGSRQNPITLNPITNLFGG